VQEARGVRAKDRGRGIGDQVALARGAWAGQGARHLGFAKALVVEMPHTHALLSGGQISEWIATLLVKETAVLTVADRRAVDQRLCAMGFDPVTGEVRAPFVVGLGPRRVEAAARSLAAELDPEAVVRRSGKAAKDRKVTTRPAPDSMVWVSGLVPVGPGVACWASLDRAARSLKAQGDPRSLDQIRADLFVERLTGQATAAAVPTEVCLVMAQETLTGEPGNDTGDDTGNDTGNDICDGCSGDRDGDGSGDRDGGGDGDRDGGGDGTGGGADHDREGAERPARTADGTVVPAQVARDWIEQAEAAGADLWIREVRTHPVTGQVTDIGPRKRYHRGTDAAYLRLRDQLCRHPGCERPIAHGDHPEPVAEGGPTTRANSQGLCEGHNYVKEMPGWAHRVVDGRPGHHTIEVTTPTGHTYRSHAPPGLPPTL
jgi:hypothetical protein